MQHRGTNRRAFTFYGPSRSLRNCRPNLTVNPSPPKAHEKFCAILHCILQFRHTSASHLSREKLLALCACWLSMTMIIVTAFILLLVFTYIERSPFYKQAISFWRILYETVLFTLKLDFTSYTLSQGSSEHSLLSQTPIYRTKSKVAAETLALFVWIRADFSQGFWPNLLTYSLKE